MQCDYNRDCQFEFYPFVNFKKFQSSCHLKSVITSQNWLEKAGLGLVPLVSSSTTTETWTENWRQLVRKSYLKSKTTNVNVLLIRKEKVTHDTR